MSDNWWKEDLDAAPGTGSQQPQSVAPARTGMPPIGDNDWWKVDLEDQGKPGAPGAAKKPAVHEPTIGGLNKTPTGPMSWKDLGKMAVEDWSKSLMSAVATPARWGWDAGKWYEQTKAKLSGDQKAIDKANAIPDFHDSMSGSMVRGVPVVRDMVPQSEGDIKWQQEHPTAEAVGNFAGAMVPALATMGVGAPVAGANTWGNAARYAATQSGINTGLNTADRVVHSNNQATMDELLRGGAKDVALSSVVPFASKFAAPNAKLAGENAGQSIMRMAQTQDDLANIAKYTDKFKGMTGADKVPLPAYMLAAEALNTLKGGFHGTGAVVAGAANYLPQLANMRAMNPGLGGYANKGLEATTIGTSNFLDKLSEQDRNKLRHLIPSR